MTWNIENISIVEVEFKKKIYLKKKKILSIFIIIKGSYEKNIHKIFLKILENMKIIRLFNFVKMSIKLFDKLLSVLKFCI